jgi:DNA-binding transcriptional LysR family regulator
MSLVPLRTFVEVMRRGSFVAVARDRSVAPSSVSRAVASLEAELGVRLMHRTTRRITPTEAGLRYFERVQSIVDELDRAGQLALDTTARPQGTLRITAPVTFAELNVVPLLPAFAKKNPDLRFEIFSTNTFLDLVAERIDIALRVGDRAPSTFVSVRLCPLRYLVCASPSYLARRGRPKTPADLAKHDCMWLPSQIEPAWTLAREGTAQTVPVHGRIAISNMEALRQCAAGGLGIAMIPRWVAAQSLAEGSLVEVLADYEAGRTAEAQSVWAIYPSRSYLPQKVRVFLDFLKAEFERGLPGERPEFFGEPSFKRRVRARASRGSGARDRDRASARRGSR